MLFKLSKHKPKTENNMILGKSKNMKKYPKSLSRKNKHENNLKTGKNNHERRTKNRLRKTDFKNPSEHNTLL